nr:two-component regulator propeller domain-containing protein [Hymenobacter radiodurans]
MCLGWGLNKVDLRQKPFGLIRQQLTGRRALSNNYINAIYKDETRNTLWFGSRNGVTSYDLNQQTYHHYLNQQASSPRGVDVSAVFQARNGMLWFGTRADGLVTLSQSGGREKLTTYTKLADGTDLSAESIERIVQDRDGTIWAATFATGLHRFSPTGQHLGTYRTNNSALPTDQFTFLLFDFQRDVMWASTRDAGLLKLRIRGDSLQVLAQYQYAPSAPTAYASTMYGPCCWMSRVRYGSVPLAGGYTSCVPMRRGAKPCIIMIKSYRKAT